MQDVLSIAGTRTSHRWSEVPGSFDTVNARAIYPSGNEWGIPDLPAAATACPARLVEYTDRHACEKPRTGDAAHFFLDDYRFEACWSKPERPLTRLQRVGLALTPDFSLYTGMPMAMQLWQVYRSRWCGRWMLEHGVDVVPTVSWSTPESYRYCFAGIPRRSAVAISTVGVLRDAEARTLFAAGFEALIGLIWPARILCYGKLPPGLSCPVPLTEYPTRWDR